MALREVRKEKLEEDWEMKEVYTFKKKGKRKDKSRGRTIE